MLLVLKLVGLFTDEVSAVLVPVVEVDTLSSTEVLRLLNASSHNASTSDLKDGVMKILSSEKKQGDYVTLGTDGALFNEATVTSSWSKSVDRLSDIKVDEAVVESVDISLEDSCCK